MTSQIITVKDINELRKNIRAWGKGNRDRTLAKCYAKDREDLGRLLDFIEDGNRAKAADLASSLDTIVRDQIPTPLYDKINNQYEEADPANDEFKCVACKKVHDIEDGVRDRRTNKLYCVACADERVAIPVTWSPRVPQAYRE